MYFFSNNGNSEANVFLELHELINVCLNVMYRIFIWILL